METGEEAAVVSHTIDKRRDISPQKELYKGAREMITVIGQEIVIGPFELWFERIEDGIDVFCWPSELS